jgi:NAD-dependent deacetylase
MTSARPSSRLLDLLRGDEPILVLTGAGVSAESGLATFRGPGGIWEGHEPGTLATPEAFARDPETVWRFYAWRRAQALRARPNAAHEAIAALDGRRGEFLLATQNVDGLHARAGSRRLVELHGTLWRLRCSAEGTERDDVREDLGPLPPRCACGALLRPAVVWFGETLPAEAFRSAVRAAERARLVLVVGTSGLVHPAASIPIHASRSGAWVVEINPESTPLSEIADERLAGPAALVLPSIVEAAFGTGEVHR